MQVIPLILCTLFHVFLLLPHANAAATISKTITVNKNGGADFSSIQAAINSIPDYNNQWIKVQVAAGVYRSPSSPTLSFPYTSSTSPFRSRCREKVTVGSKGFILLQGEGAQQTSIEWGGYSGDAAGDDTATSATFTTYGANFVARDITFKVSHSYHRHPTLVRRNHRFMTWILHVAEHVYWQYKGAGGGSVGSGRQVFLLQLQVH